MTETSDHGRLAPFGTGGALLGLALAVAGWAVIVALVVALAVIR